MSSSSQNPAGSSVRNVIEHALRVYYADSSDPNGLVAVLLDAYRAEILREEMTNLRRVEREEVPEGALGTRTGLLKAALILDERAEDIEANASRERTQGGAS